MERIANRTRLIPSLRFTAAITLSAWLAGCAVTQGTPGGEHAQPIPEAHESWFSGGLDTNIDSMDWDQINRAQDLIETGRYDEAIEHLQPLIERYVPPAYYEMAKLYDQGLGVEQDPLKLLASTVKRLSSLRPYAAMPR